MKVTKVVCVGLKGIGKTSFIEQMIYSNLGQQDIHPTIEDIYEIMVRTDRGTKENLRIFDIEGFGVEKSEIVINKIYHSLADAFCIIYTAENRQSFDVIEYLRRDIEKNKEKRDVTIVLIRLASRSPDKVVEVDEALAVNLATREKIFHFDVNLADRKSLFPPFIHIASKLNPPTAAKTTFAPLGTFGTSKKTNKE